MSTDQENKMSRDEIRVRRNEIISDISERSNIQFGDYILTSSDMSNLLDYRNKSKNMVIPFIYNKVVDYIDKGIVIFVDGGGKEKNTIKGINHREVVAIQMAYLLCVALVDKNPLLDLNTVLKRIEFDSLVRNIFDYSTADETLNALSKYNVLIITDLNTKSVKTFSRSSRDSTKEDEGKSERIGLYFDDLVQKRIMGRKITIVTVFEDFDDVSANYNIYRFGSRIKEMFESVKDTPNIFEDEIHSDLKFCRIHLPSLEDSKKLSFKKSTVDDFRKIVLEKKIDHSGLEEVISSILNTIKTSEYENYDSKSVFTTLCSVVSRTGDEDRLNTLFDLCKKDPGLVIMLGGDKKW